MSVENPEVRLDDLNREQLAAVTGPSAHTLVLAGAGTGKTTVLTRRIAWMCRDKGVPPNRVMAVTFTNKAANEMRTRVEDMMGGDTEGMMVGTFHGIAHKLLRRHSGAAGLPEKWYVVDSTDQDKLAKRVLEMPQHQGSGLTNKDLAQHVNSEKDEGRRAPAVPVEPLDMAYADYQTLCDQIGAVDFGELLLRTKEMFERNDVLRLRYSNQFRHILVDEFQDTNAVQYDLVKQLAEPKNRLWAVGDDDQSIYAWRGAKPQNMRRFKDEFSKDNDVTLVRNYRSTGTILAAANSVISNNDDRIGKDLVSDKGEGSLIDVVAAKDPYDEGRVVAQNASDWIAQGGEPDDVAVLYRTSAQSRLIEQHLVNSGIRYTVKGGVKFYEREEIRDVVGYMRMLRSDADDVAFERIVNKPARGIGAKGLESIRNRANDEATSLWAAANAIMDEPETKTAMKTALREFTTLITDMRSGMHEMSVAEMAEMCADKSGLRLAHGAKNDEQAKSKVENIDELAVACSEHGTLDGFLDDAVLVADDRDPDEPAVQLMTMHSAKGLEFPLVVLAGMDDKMMPHPRSDDESEERRLAYVAITRAKDKLVLSYPKKRSFGTGQNATVTSKSMFLDEIPRGLLNTVDRGWSRDSDTRQRKRDNGRYRKRGRKNSYRRNNYYGRGGR